MRLLGGTPHMYLFICLSVYVAVVGASSAWNCCDGATEAEGCQVSPCHVTETQDFSNMRGFVTSLDKGDAEEGGGRVWAMDCEMVNTTVGSELVRVTLLDHAGNTAYESLVMPPNKILDYNTRSAKHLQFKPIIICSIRTFISHCSHVS